MGIGVGAVAAATFDTLSGKARELATNLRDGKIQADEIGFEIGKDVPIFGSLLSGADNVREALKGTRHELELTTEITGKLVALNDDWYASMLKVSELRRQEAIAEKHDQREIASIGLRGSDAQRESIENKYSDLKDANNEARSQARDAASNDPALKKAQEEAKAFQEKYGMRMDQLRTSASVRSHGIGMGYGMGIGLGFNSATGGSEELEGLEKHFRELQDAEKKAGDAANATRDARISASDQSDSRNKAKQQKELDEWKKLHDEKLNVDKRSAKAESDFAKSQTSAENLGTLGNVNESARMELDARIESQKEQERIKAKAAINATTDAAERSQIESDLQRRLTDIDAKGNADRARLQRDFNIETKRYQYEASRAEADAVAVTAENNLRLQGRSFEAEQAAQKRAHDRRNEDIEQKAAEDIARDKDHAAEIRRRANAEKQANDQQFAQQRYEQYVGLYHQGASGNPLGEFASAGRTSGRAELFRQSFNPAAQLLEIARQQLRESQRQTKATEGVANAINGSSGGTNTPIFPLQRSA